MESHTSCPVCHEGIDVHAIGCCDHVICYKCSSRMRVLCEQFYCPVCRTDLPQVYLIKDCLKYSDIPRYGYIPNRRYKLFFQNDKVKKLFEKLLENRCPICTNGRTERSLKELQNHMRKEHTLFYCDLCVDHLKLFPSERKYYNRRDLALHRRQGDKDDKSYKEHPLCQFCDERYMDNDELYRHLRKDHFFCHFCDPEGSREFYNDYTSLRNHFKEKHYLCQEGACSGPEIRLTHAFLSKIDLQAHTTAEHSNNLTKAQAKQMRTIDIDYHLTPRDRRRDRGVVSSADYEETGSIQNKVYNNSRGRGGRPRYEESRGFKKGNFSEEDVQRAISASLDVMKEKEKKEEPEEPKKSEKIVRDAENFPVLGNVKPDLLCVDSPVDSDHKDSDSEALDFSMAKQLALKNKRSVQYGRLISDEFPSLPGEATSDTTSNNANPVTSVQPTKNKKPAKKSEPHAKSKFTNAVNKGPMQDEDFPGLPSKSSGHNSTVGSWVTKKPAENKQSSSVPVKITVNKNIDNERPKSTKSNKKAPKMMNDDNDFPSLGGQAAASGNKNMNWLQKSSFEKSKPKSAKKEVDWFDLNDNFEFSIENVKNQSESINVDDKKTSNSDTKKKKKKKDKAKKSEISSSKSKFEDASLDSIASTLLNNQKESKAELEISSSNEDSPRNGINEDVVDYERIIQNKEKKTEFVQKLIDMDENKFSILSEEPETEFLVETKPVSSRSAPKKKNIELNLDDFPSLSAVNPTKAPPPGFAKPLPTTASSSKKPPGFDDVSSSSKRPPPGFGASQPNGHPSTDVKPCSLSLKNIMMPEMSNFEYVPPLDSKTRNQKLYQKIMSYLSTDEESFNQFKSASAAFRTGSTSGMEYYKQCEKLIGKDNFDAIFPELVVLLPDIGKQQDLLNTYKELQGKKSDNVIRISGKSADAPWKQSVNFQSCPTCRQVLLSCDLSDHTSVHGKTSDFPSLSGGGGGFGLRDFVKGN